MNTLLTANPNGSRALLIKCLVISLAVHAAALIFFYFNPLILQGPLQSLFGISSATPSLLEIEEEEAELVQKNEELKEVFEQIIVLSPHLQQPYDLAELPKGIALAPNDEEADFKPSAKFQSIEFHDKKFASTSPDLPQETEDPGAPFFFTPPETGTRFASQLQIDADLFVPEVPALSLSQSPYADMIALSEYSLKASFEADYSLKLAAQNEASSNELQLKTDVKPITGQVTTKELGLDKEHSRSTLFIPKAPAAAVEKKKVEVASSVAEIEEYDFPALATAAAWNDDFDVDVTFLPNPDGKGYIFSLSLSPNCDISSHSLKQNLYFIIDRSNSVQKHRFAVFKRAVVKALASMQHGDAFNIIIMDKKIVRFSPENRSVSMKNIQAAEEFLDKQEAGGLFAAGDIYTTLGKVLDSIPENNEMQTAILLTDGKTDLNTSRKQLTFKNWVEKNNSKLSLYTAAIGRDNDLVSLDLLSSISGGKLLYSDTHASFPRKLSKLVLDLKDPIAKEMMVTAIPSNPHAHIEFYSATTHLASLYSHQPYVVVGQIDDPCTFDLVLQGRHGDQWIAIKKHVSFIEGRKGDHELVKEWKAQRANICYADFLKEGKASHLKEAKEILKKSRTEIAFE